MTGLRPLSDILIIQSLQKAIVDGWQYLQWLALFKESVSLSGGAKYFFLICI